MSQWKDRVYYTIQSFIIFLYLGKNKSYNLHTYLQNPGNSISTLIKMTNDTRRWYSLYNWIYIFIFATLFTVMFKNVKIVRYNICLSLLYVHILLNKYNAESWKKLTHSDLYINIDKNSSVQAKKRWILFL